MPKRSISTEIWRKRSFKLRAEEPLTKLVYVYCILHPDLTACGMAYVDPAIIALDLGLKEKDALAQMVKLAPKVHYDSDRHLLWVRNFIRKQWAGLKWMTAVNRSLKEFENCTSPILGMFYEEYKEFKDIAIPHRWGIDTGSIPVQSDLLLNINNKDSFNESEVPKKPEPKVERTAYGIEGNVYLSSEEYKKAEAEGILYLVDELSLYMASKGAKYKSHLAALRAWHRRRSGGTPQTPSSGHPTQPGGLKPATSAEELRRRHSQRPVEVTEKGDF